MRNLGRTGILIDELLQFYIEPSCSDVCGNHQCPQTLAEICSNIGICWGFRAVATKEKYSRFILLHNIKTCDYISMV